MKKLLLLVVCVFVLSSPSAAQKKPRVDLEKKIAEATPEALPQSPISKKARTDARDKNLKGKVKSVIEYAQHPGRVREIDGEQHYNEDGNLIKTVYYTEGYPDSVVVWDTLTDTG